MMNWYSAIKIENAEQAAAEWNDKHRLRQPLSVHNDFVSRSAKLIGLHNKKGRAKRTLLLTLALLAFFSIFSIITVEAVTLTDEQPADVATSWFALQLQLVEETPGYTPPVASRAFGYSAITLYEAVVAGMPGHQSLTGQLSELEALPEPEPELEYHWPTVANSALASITRSMFPTASDANRETITMLEESFANTYSTRPAPDVLSRSVSYGQAVADAIYTWSMTDGGHEGYLTNFDATYQPPEGTGMWIPTPRLSGADPQPALQPYWGDNRPFVLESDETCMAAEHPPYSEEPASVFYAEALEVYEVSQQLTAEQAEIAVFWADDPGQTATPPGHSMAILTQLLRQEAVTLDFAAEAYARLGIAVNDAFIGCWNAKYAYNLIRPVSYIHALMDNSWMPIVDTPPFPEYPSGHSVQTGAAATVLIALFGDDYAFSDHTHDDQGLAPRSFTSFTEMENEAALSRLYGGIHYRAAIELGLEQGHCIGEQVNDLQFLQS